MQPQKRRKGVPSHRGLQRHHKELAERWHMSLAVVSLESFVSVFANHLCDVCPLPSHQRVIHRVSLVRSLMFVASRPNGQQTALGN